MIVFTVASFHMFFTLLKCMEFSFIPISTFPNTKTTPPYYFFLIHNVDIYKFVITTKHQ